MSPTYQTLIAKFTKKRDSARADFSYKHPHAKKLLASRRFDLSQVREHSARILAGSTLGAALLLSAPHFPKIAKTSSAGENFQFTSDQLIMLIKNLPPKIPRPLLKENSITEAVRQKYGVDASFELNGNRLPYYHGGMGLEQHLYRFSGDTPEAHSFYPQEGIAPLKGAFGYFQRPGISQAQWTKEEQYYVVLQTFLIPTWNQDWVKLKAWYAFRKFIVINPENGKAVVAVLGDSGPAVWTGKVFGGSPEVMQTLGFLPKYTRGDVVILFLNDPDNKVPLGPLESGIKEI